MDQARARAYDAEILICHACKVADIADRMYRADHGDPAGMRRRIFEKTPVWPPPTG